MRIRNILTSLLVIISITVSAAPALREYRQYHQPDGSVVSLMLVGDEYGHYYLTDDKQMVLKSGDGYFFATTDDSGNLSASNMLASDYMQRSLTQIAFLSGLDNNKLYQAFDRKRINNPMLKIVSTSGPMKAPGLVEGNTVQRTGSPHYLVILVEYQDVKFQTPNANAYFSNMMHQQGFSQYGGTGSALDYFRDMSQGQFTPQFDVYGPVTLPNIRAYYGGNGDAMAYRMAPDACQLLDSQVDFTQYDTNGDGDIDNVFIFFAGLGQNIGGGDDCVWPHAWNVYDGANYPVRVDGVRVNRYACTNEWRGSAPDGLGTFIHEFSHVLGLPDLYTTSSAPSGTGLLTPGKYDVMDSGLYNNDSRTPTGYSAFERYALGWLTPNTLREGQGNSIELPNIANSNKSYIINTTTVGGSVAEYFMLENRQTTGWDAYIPNSGMLLWHIDYRTSKWRDNNPNDDPNHQFIDLIEAGGVANKANSTIMKQYPFPGSNNITSFNNFYNWGGDYLNYPLTNIRHSGGVITLDVCGGGIAVNPPTASHTSGVYNNPFTLTLTPDEAGNVIKYERYNAQGVRSQGTYYSPIEMNEDCQITYWAEKAGHQSERQQLSFEFRPGKPQITANTGAGTMPQISITTSTQNAVIYYTTDGSTPTTSSTRYTGSFTPSNGAAMVRAIATYGNWRNSEVAQYQLPQSGQATFDFYHAWERAGQSNWTASYATHYVTFDEADVTITAGHQPSVDADYPIAQGADITVAARTGYYPIKGIYIKCRQIGSGAQTMTLQYSSGSTTYTTLYGVSANDFELICNELPNSVLSSVRNIRVKFSSSSTPFAIEKIVIAYGNNSSPIVVPGHDVATPVISPESAYNLETFPQVSISCDTPNSIIYYTTGNSEFSTSTWTHYIQPFTPADAQAVTVRAVAVRSGWTNSEEARVTYTKTAPIVAEPVITPESGVYPEMPEVSINCPTQGATIYYDIDYSENWQLYEGAFTPDESEHVTIRAYAVKEGLIDSPTVAAVYDIHEPEPIVLPYGAYIPVSNIDELTAGTKIVVVAKDYDYALGTTQNTNNRSAGAIYHQQLEGVEYIIPDNGVQILTIEQSGDYYMLHVGEDGYLCTTTSSKNYLRTETDPDERGEASITINADGSADIIFRSGNGDTRTILRYNNEDNLFSCGPIGWMQSICLYRQANSDELMKPTFSMTSAKIIAVENDALQILCEIEHSDYDDVSHYEIWAIDLGKIVEPDIQQSPTDTENMVGHTIINEGINNDSFTATVPLTITLADGKHNISVHAHAVLKDGETIVYSNAYTEGSEAGELGLQPLLLDPDLLTGISLNYDYDYDFDYDFDFDFDVEYYNMQGIRVTNPSAGYYLRKQRGRVSKVYVK